MANSNTLLLIICLLLILVTTLGVNYFFHQKEQERLRRRQLAKQLRREIEQTLDALLILKNRTGPAGIRELLSDYSTELIGRLRALNPKSDIMQQLQSQKEGGLGDGGGSLNNANTIQRTQAGIRNAIKTLATLQQRGKLTPLTFGEYRHELLWLHCQVETDAYIEQAKRFAATKKTALAMSHLKHAKITVTKAVTRDPRKQEKINEINQLYDEVNPYKKTPSAPGPASAETGQPTSS